jgi:hypothetical protein
MRATEPNAPNYINEIGLQVAISRACPPPFKSGIKTRCL